MASFYNHYYNYYRPHFSNNMKSISKERMPDKFEKKETTENEDRNNYTTNNNVKKNYQINNNNSASGFRSFGPISFKNHFFSDIEEPIFEILGINLFLDDIIILGLLFFLYKEGVQDELLYIALIMLLLS